MKARGPCLVERGVVPVMSSPLHLSTLWWEHIASVEAHQHKLVPMISSLSLPCSFRAKKEALQGARNNSAGFSKIVNH